MVALADLAHVWPPQRAATILAGVHFLGWPQDDMSTAAPV